MTTIRRRAGQIAKTRLDPIGADQTIASLDAELDAITRQIAEDEEHGVYKAATWDKRRDCLERRRTAVRAAKVVS